MAFRTVFYTLPLPFSSSLHAPFCLFLDLPGPIPYQVELHLAMNTQLRSENDVLLSEAIFGHSHPIHHVHLFVHLDRMCVHPSVMLKFHILESTAERCEISYRISLVHESTLLLIVSTTRFCYGHKTRSWWLWLKDR